MFDLLSSGYRHWVGSRLPRIRDIAVMGVAIASLVWQFMSIGDYSGAAWSVAGVSIMGALALWWRRRFPIAIACVGILVCAISGSSTMMLLAICTVAVRRRDRSLVVLSVCGALVDATYTYFRISSQDFPRVLATTAFVVAAFAVLGAYLGVRRGYLESLRERVRHAEAEREARAEQARLAERARIARDMHDVIAHKVSLIALHAGVLQMTQVPDVDRVHRTAGLIGDAARDALTDLRGVLGVLRDTSDKPDESRPELPQPLLRDIPQLIGTSRAAGVPIVENISADLESPAPSALAHSAFRVVQEALTNVHKHAAGAMTIINIEGAAGRELTIEVVNSAPAEPVSAPSPVGTGTGLDGLRHRIAVVRGTLDSGPTADGGFRVIARAPWPKDQSTPLSN